MAYDFETVAAFVNFNCETCHVGPVGDSHDPDLRNDQNQLYATLTTYTVPRCGNKPLIDPGNPDNSALIAAITGGQCGELPQMPYGCGEFCEVPNEIPALRQWIADGAQQ